MNGKPYSTILTLLLYNCQENIQFRVVGACSEALWHSGGSSQAEIRLVVHSLSFESSLSTAIFVSIFSTTTLLRYFPNMHSISLQRGVRGRGRARSSESS